MIAVFSYVKDCHRQEASDNFVQIQGADLGLVGGSCREANLAQ